MINKRLLIIHNDLDGASVLPLALLYNFKFDDLYICDYKERDEEGFFENLIKSYTDIIFSDFSPTTEQLNYILSQGKIVEIYDHHKTSEELLKVSHPNLKIVHDNNKSGTKIFYENCIKQLITKNKPIIEEFVNLVSTYDLYLTESEIWENAINLNRVLYGLIDYKKTQYESYKKYIDKIINKLYYYNEWFWDEQELMIIEKDKKKEDRLFNDCKYILQKRTDSKGNLFGIFHASSKISIICHRILKEMTDLKYVLCINTYDKIDGTGWKKISARSRNSDEFSVLTLDGFEGHECATGRECDIDFSKDLFMGKINEVEYKK